MRSRFAKVAMGVVLSALVVAPLGSAFAQQTPNDLRVDLKLVDADMMFAAQSLFRQTGIQFVVEPSSEPFKKVTLSLKDVTPEDAVRYICRSAGAEFRRDENGVYIIGRSKPVEAVPALVESRPGKKAGVVKKLRVMQADVRDVLQMIVYGESMRNGFDDLKKFGSQFSTEAKRMFGSNVLIQGNVSPVGSFGPATTPNQLSPLSGVENGTQIAVPGEVAKQRGGGGGGMMGGGGMGGGQLGGGQGGGLGGGGLGGGGLGGGGLGQGGGGNLQGGQGLVPEGIDFISFDPSDNSFIVRGDPDAIDALRKIIADYDVAPIQVQVKVEFITTSETVSKSLGYDFLYQRGTVFAGTRPGSFTRSTDPVFLNYATGNVTMRLRASLTQGDGRVVSAPIVRTLNNQPATVFSTEQTTIFVNSAIVTQGTVVNQANPFPLTASTFLTVAPRVNFESGGSKSVTLFLTPQIQEFSGFSTGPNGEQIPNIITQGVSVVARVKNGETMVLGGVTRKNETNNTNRVPVLSELPIVGQFFRSLVRNRTTSELLIFVTPTVIDDGDTTFGG